MSCILQVPEEMLEIAKGELCLDIKHENVNGIASSVREELMMEKRAKSANIAKKLDEGIQKSKNEQATASALHSQTNNDNKHDDIEEVLNVSEDECHEGDNDIAMFACVLVSVSCVLKVNQVSELFSVCISPVAQCWTTEYSPLGKEFSRTIYVIAHTFYM